MTTDLSTLSRIHPSAGNVMLGLYEDPRHPDRIIKMVDPRHDGYFAYACWLLVNKSRSPHFLKVYSIEMLDECRALVTVERLEDGHNLDDNLVCQMNNQLMGDNRCAKDSPIQEAVDLIYQDLGKTWIGDLHSGNFMTRPSDNTPVINDPLFGRRL